MTALQISIIVDETGKMQITGIPNTEEERKKAIQVLATAIKTVAALAPPSPIIKLTP